MTETTKPVVTQAARDSIAKTMADLYEATKAIGGPTFGQYADAILAKHRLAHSPSEPSVVSQDLVPTIAMALCQNALGGKRCPCREGGMFVCEYDHPGQQARAILPIIEAAQIAARNQALDEAAKACEAQQQAFLSEQYATGQPFSSIGERVACGVCASAIQALRSQGAE